MGTVGFKERLQGSMEGAELRAFVEIRSELAAGFHDPMR